MNTEIRSFVRPILFVAIPLLLLLGGIFALREYLSYQIVTVINQSEVEYITIFSDEGSDQGSITEGEIRLKEGAYYYVPEGAGYTSERTEFTVDGDRELLVNPAYSIERLAALLNDRREDIRSVLEQNYSAQLDNEFRIVEERLHLQGQWYTTKLARVSQGGSQPDFYRVILEYSEDAWEIAAEPAFVIAEHSHQTIPVSVIEAVNQAPLQSTYQQLLGQ